MTDFVETEIGRLPATWKVATLGNVAKVGNGSTPKRGNDAYWQSGTIPWLNSAKIHERFISQADQFVTDTAMKECHLPRVKANSLLIAITGQGKTLGNSALVMFETCINQHLAYAQFTTDRVLPEFVLWFMQTRYEHLRSISQAGGSTKGALTCGYLKTYPVPIPPLAEQQRIAGVLGLVHRAVEQQERLRALVAELKQTLHHHLFTHGLRGEPQKPTDLGPIPKSWEHRPLEKAGDVIYGIQAAVACNLKPVGTKILTNKNITLDGKIDLQAINYFELKTARHHATLLKKGDLLFNWRSGSKEHVGKTAYFDLGGEFTHSSFILRIRPHDELTGKFLFYFLNFLRESGYFVKSQTYSVNAKFNKSAINALPTFIPNEVERREIVEMLDAVGSKLAVHERKHAALTSLFRTLLHQLMTAQLRVADLDVESLLAPSVPEPELAPT